MTKAVDVTANVNVIALTTTDEQGRPGQIVVALVGQQADLRERLTVAVLSIWPDDPTANNVVQSVEMSRANYLKLYAELLAVAREAGFVFDATALRHWQDKTEINIVLGGRRAKNDNGRQHVMTPSPFIKRSEA